MGAHNPEAEPLQSKSEESFTTDEPDQQNSYSDKDVWARFKYAGEESLSQRRQFWRRSFVIPVIIHLILIAMYSGIFLHAMKSHPVIPSGNLYCELDEFN